ncbi:MAG: phosphoribosylformylglycinamidine synthase I [Roseiflexaceae bacterium]
MTPRVLILRAPGINRDEDAAAAIELAGGRPERVHVNQLVSGSVKLNDYAMLIVPGGFSYGDHLGAGKLLAIDLAHRLGNQIHAFVADHRPVIGICNGFQVLVKAGILPGIVEQGEPIATLTDNASGQFECRWVDLAADQTSTCHFTKGLEHPIEVPVAHGEGRFVVRDETALAQLRANGQIAFRYVNKDGSAAAYPANPNGSDDQIAGICNAAGNVLGMMPHPEDAIRPHQHPRWTREALRAEGDGLVLFRNAITYASSL